VRFDLIGGRCCSMMGFSRRRCSATPASWFIHLRLILCLSKTVTPSLLNLDDALSPSLFTFGWL
jgi:hypothetical protein